PSTTSDTDNATNENETQVNIINALLSEIWASVSTSSSSGCFASDT
ncbi:unnamed protein product, partial [Adineta steineri]